MQKVKLCKIIKLIFKGLPVNGLGGGMGPAPTRINPNNSYNWSETGSCISDTASTSILPNHMSRRNLLLGERAGKSSAEKNTIGSALETTDYGFIDGPPGSGPNRRLPSVPKSTPSPSSTLTAAHAQRNHKNQSGGKNSPTTVK